jgi:peroxiredoxin family protein
MSTLKTESLPSEAHARDEDRIAKLEAKLEEFQKRLPEDRVSIVLFSGDLDRVLAAFIIATGAAAMGQQVSMFVTFWGYNAIRRSRRMAGKNLMQRMLALMTPSSSKAMPLSKLNMFGMGAKMMRAMMKQKGVSSVEELESLARELGVRIVACEMSRDVMGISEEEIEPGLEAGGVASFLGDALRSKATIFI